MISPEVNENTETKMTKHTCVFKENDDATIQASLTNKLN